MLCGGYNQPNVMKVRLKHANCMAQESAHSLLNFVCTHRPATRSCCCPVFDRAAGGKISSVPGPAVAAAPSVGGDVTPPTLGRCEAAACPAAAWRCLDGITAVVTFIWLQISSDEGCQDILRRLAAPALGFHGRPALFRFHNLSARFALLWLPAP